VIFLSVGNHTNLHLDLAEVDGLQQARLGGEGRGVEDPTSGGDDLTAAAVDGISVQRHVVDVEAHAAHVLVTQHTLQDNQSHCSSIWIQIQRIPGRIRNTDHHRPYQYLLLSKIPVFNKNKIPDHKIFARLLRC
jgi:hypothetical protein